SLFFQKLRYGCNENAHSNRFAALHLMKLHNRFACFSCLDIHILVEREKRSIYPINPKLRREKIYGCDDYYGIYIILCPHYRHWIYDKPRGIKTCRFYFRREKTARLGTCLLREGNRRICLALAWLYRLRFYDRTFRNMGSRRDCHWNYFCLAFSRQTIYAGNGQI